jgi:hypothetical protein
MAVLKQYRWLRADGTWSKPMGPVKIMVVAGKRIVTGKGPFFITKNSDQIGANLSRADCVRRLSRALRNSAKHDSFRVHRVVRSLSVAPWSGSVVVLAVRTVAPKDLLDPRRAAMVSWAKWGIAHTGSIHYTQARPFPIYRSAHLPLYLDCSGSTITYAMWADCPNPTGGSFNGSGNTDSIDNHLSRTADPQLGDLVMWNGHVAVIIETGSDPLLASHGSEIGPLSIRLSAENRYHSGGYHFLSIL